MVGNWTIFQLLPPISFEKTVLLGKTAIFSSNWRSSKCCFTDRNWSPLNPNPKKELCAQLNQLIVFITKIQVFIIIVDSKTSIDPNLILRGLEDMCFLLRRAFLLSGFQQKQNPSPKKTKRCQSFMDDFYMLFFLLDLFFFGGGNGWNMNLKTTSI